jgi:hypothetical protein
LIITEANSHAECSLNLDLFSIAWTRMGEWWNRRAVAV